MMTLVAVMVQDGLKMRMTPEKMVIIKSIIDDLKYEEPWRQDKKMIDALESLVADYEILVEVQQDFK
jgi:hypothetical protein